MVTIYKMLDPDTKQIRYIGKTTKTIAQRLNGHLHGRESGQSQEMRGWLDGLIAAGKRPVMEQIAVVNDEDAKAMELGMIYFYSTRLNASLFNGYKFPGVIPLDRLDAHNPKTEAEAVKAILTEAPPVKFLLR